MAGSENRTAVVLTIAGFDPSGGAGIIADVRTILHFGCRPVAAITSLTFQNTERVFGAIHESARSVRAQILPVIEESPVAGVKIGMLPTAEIVLEIARMIRAQTLPPPVIDPVMRSSSGFELVEQDAIEALRSELIPLARLITPNVPEAEALTGVRIEDEQGMRSAAEKLREMGARAVLIKGGHLSQESEVRGQKSEGRQATDLLMDQDEVTVFRGEWIDTPPVRGTGCMMSSAIASNLARGNSLPESVRVAKLFVADVIRDAPKLGLIP
ncbi:MAG TPA: bifunctional hydroxymethylpyrimidine kinase/phosphomethylpyrimidine kinase [Blastocatellia bacterium]|nr:bifunctional hydroxymethylpyrimidine kinase/phosphomethylpyrimidine kinase [Blastocatellia bacterium]